MVERRSALHPAGQDWGTVAAGRRGQAGEDVLEVPSHGCGEGVLVALGARRVWALPQLDLPLVAPLPGGGLGGKGLGLGMSGGADLRGIPLARPSAVLRSMILAVVDTSNIGCCQRPRSVAAVRGLADLEIPWYHQKCVGSTTGVHRTYPACIGYIGASGTSVVRGAGFEDGD